MQTKSRTNPNSKLEFNRRRRQDITTRDEKSLVGLISFLSSWSKRRLSLFDWSQEASRISSWPKWSSNDTQQMNLEKGNLRSFKIIEYLPCPTKLVDELNRFKFLLSWRILRPGETTIYISTTSCSCTIGKSRKNVLKIEFSTSLQVTTLNLLLDLTHFRWILLYSVETNINL